MAWPDQVGVGSGCCNGCASDMLAGAGDLIIARTTGFHRGTKVKSRDRYMYTINYVVHPEEFKQPTFKVREEYLNLLSEEDRPILDFLIKS